MTFEQECLANLAAKEMTPACDNLPHTQVAPYHCEDLNQIDPKMHLACSEAKLYLFPIPVVACLHKNNSGQFDGFEYYDPETVIEECLKKSKDGWTPHICYCCCSCLAYGTPIAVPDGNRVVQDLAIGDSVLAGWRQSPGEAPSWRPVPLTFSEGIATETDHFAVYLAYGNDEETDDLICTGDQPLMLSDGKLTTAGRLRRGDVLLRGDGTVAEVKTIAVGEYRGGIHHIGTGVPRTGPDERPPIDGHLIGAGGLVAGDYYLQLYLASIEPEQLAGDHHERPEIGTPEYARENGEAQADVGMLFGDPQSAEAQHGRFKVYAGTGIVEGPAASLLTRQQAADVLTNGTFTPLSSGLPKGLVETAFRHLRGFFPNVVFYLDWLDMEPNVHALERYGEKLVVITGGLARLIHFNYQGLFFAICSGLGRLSQMAPLGVDGFSGTGAADSWAFGVPPRVMFPEGNGLELSLEGMRAFKTLFGLVDPAHAGGNPDDPVNEPSLECRLKCISAAIGGGGVPPCAGGPEPRLVELNSVFATPTTAQVYLSTPPTKQSAEDASHYNLSPAATVTSAKVSPNSNLAVVLEVELEAGGEYELTISGIESMQGTGVDPKADSVKFTVQKEGT